MTTKAFRLAVPEAGSEVSALLVNALDADRLLVFAHGAGAGMTHPFMEAVTLRLVDHGVSTLRFQLPYMEQGRRRPDTAAVCMATIRTAIDEAVGQAGGLPVFAGGKSMGGRMTSMALAEQPDDRVHGIVFFGFPLHPSGRPGTARAIHLADVATPMLFLQGTRDKLADLPCLEPVVQALGERATLHVVDGADHGFHVLKRSGRTDEDVLDELAETAGRWTDALQV